MNIEQIADDVREAVLARLKIEHSLTSAKQMPVPELTRYIRAAVEAYREEVAQAFIPEVVKLAPSETPTAGRVRSIADGADALDIPVVSVDYVADHHGVVRFAFIGETDMGSRVAITLRPAQVLAVVESFIRSAKTIDSGYVDELLA